MNYFINDPLDNLDLSAFHFRYAKDGPRNQPFHPAIMAKVMVCGYAIGVFSSRKIARKLHEDVAFRALHLAEFSELFLQVVRLAREMGLVKLGTLAVDGTNLPVSSMTPKIEKKFGKPLIGVNVATYWLAMRRFGINHKLPGIGKLTKTC